MELYALQDPQREVGPGAKAANLTAHYVIMPFVIASHRSVTFLDVVRACGCKRFTLVSGLRRRSKADQRQPPRGLYATLDLCCENFTCSHRFRVTGGPQSIIRTPSGCWTPSQTSARVPKSTPAIHLREYVPYATYTTCIADPQTNR